MKRIALSLPTYAAIYLGIFYLQNAWAALLGFHFSLIAGILLSKPTFPVSALFKGKITKWSIASLLICGMSGILLYFLWDYFKIFPNLPNELASLGLSNTTEWMLFIAYFTGINPFIEEYFWRGHLGSDAKGFHYIDFLYAGYHLLVLYGKVHPFSMIFAFVVLSLAGWFWRQIAREGKGLLIPVLGHALADFTILMAVYMKSV